MTQQLTDEEYRSFMLYRARTAVIAAVRADRAEEYGPRNAVGVSC